MTTYGTMYAVHCIQTGTHNVVQRGTLLEAESSNAMVERVWGAVHADTKRDFVTVVFGLGWARRPARGQGKGVTYIGPHRQRIYEMFMAGEADKRQRKAPTQMLEELQLEHAGVIALPGFSEISTFVGSLISRAKKGKTGMPQERLPPITMEVQTEIYNLDVKWATTKHLVGGKKYTKRRRTGTSSSFCLPLMILMNMSYADCEASVRVVPLRYKR